MKPIWVAIPVLGVAAPERKGKEAKAYFGRIIDSYRGGWVGGSYGLM
jgi:hypothetical protein